jgi:zinc D-Ala-D-Ala carboxypeptidase
MKKSTKPYNWAASKYFKKEEFDSPDLTGSGKFMVGDFMRALEQARITAGIPFFINSGFRTRAHNQKVGGAVRSEHLYGRAVDIKAEKLETKIKIIKACYQAGFRRFGIGKTFVHVDLSITKAPAVWAYKTTEADTWEQLSSLEKIALLCENLK